MPRFDRIPWDELPNDEAVFAWEAQRYADAAGSLRDAVDAYLDLHDADYVVMFLRRRIPELVGELDPEGLARIEERRQATYKKQTIPRSLWKAVMERDSYRCRKCGSWKDLEIDHVVPEFHGGPTELDNLQTLCHPCNQSKGARLA